MGPENRKPSPKKRQKTAIRLTLRNKIFIRKQEDYRTVLKEGKRYWSPHFVLYKLARPSSMSRIGIVVPKKSIKLATGRNRVKRVAREFWRNQIHSKINETADFVLIAKSSLKELQSRGIVKELSNIFNKILS